MYSLGRVAYCHNLPPAETSGSRILTRRELRYGDHRDQRARVGKPVPGSVCDGSPLCAEGTEQGKRRKEKEKKEAAGLFGWDDPAQPQNKPPSPQTVVQAWMEKELGDDASDGLQRLFAQISHALAKVAKLATFH